ncbi:MAG: hypothetical protein GY847_07515 [Proteobacteria bacterium]|nr:hypothetical protein [Pseudomonadota bacterium]
MTDSLSQVGICSTCNHLEECASRKNWKGPITFCEEFDDYLPSKKKLLLKDVKAESDILRIGNETSEYMGLCVNCDCRRTCAFPKPEGGVWHCEEYK